MTTYISQNRRLLTIIAAVIAGMWMLSTVLSHLPSFVVACLFVAAAAVAYEARSGKLRFNRGSKPRRGVSLTGTLRAQMSSYRAAAPVKTKNAKKSDGVTSAPAATPAVAEASVAVAEPETDTAPATVESLSEELFQTRLLLAQEREVVDALTDDLTADFLPED